MLKPQTIGFKEVQKPFLLIIEEDVQAKIDLICLKIHKDEWSGPIFYVEEGSLAENDLVIRVKDLYLMDIGSAAYTEYDESPDIISYRIDKDLLDMRMGLIHSHNTMPTFFSGTDTATLRQEAQNHDHFVSLIVNNTRTYSAAITTVITSKYKTSEDFSYPTFDGAVITDTDEFESEEKTIIWSKMQVILESVSYDNKEITDRLAEITEEKARIKLATSKLAIAAHVPVVNTQRVNQTSNNVNNLLKDWNRKSFSNNIEDDEYDEQGRYLGNFPKTGSEALLIPFPKGEEPEFTQAESQVLDSDIPYGIVGLEEDLVNLFAKKLVTGAILVPKKNNIDLKKFIPGMVNMYSQVFPTKESYEFFISGFIESILFNIDDPTIIGFDENEVAAIAAFSLVAELASYPKNPYLDVIIEQLENFII